MAICKAKTISGKPCKNQALNGSDYCHIKAHQQQSEFKLTDKQRRFCEFYLQTWNAADAARKAGYKGNDVTLASVGYENLRKPHIKEYIESRIKSLTMSTDEVLKRLTDWGRGSFSPFHIIKDGHLVLDLTTKQAKENIHLIKKIKQGKDGEIEIELHDSKDAVDKIAKIHGMYLEKIDHTSSDGSMSPKGIGDWYDENR